MTSNLAQLEIEARNAAEEVCQAISTMKLPELELHTVLSNEAKGSNSLDTEFWDLLCDGNHLTDDFLANLNREKFSGGTVAASA